MIELRKAFWAIALIFTFGFTKAQLTFPNGSSIDTVSNSLLMYYETQVIFNTGNFKANDYSWQKISDSLDKRWLVTACFNGDCRDSLLWEGDFLTDYGYNDTTCFIAFHVESHGYDGTSQINYKVFNKKNPSDSGLIIVHVSYINPLSIKNIVWKTEKYLVFPNPASEIVHVESKTKGKVKDPKISLIGIEGKEYDITRSIYSSYYDKYIINIKELNLTSGIYFLNVNSEEGNSEMHKILIY